MEIIIGAAVIAFVIGLISFAEYFARINSRALEAAYASLSGVIHERDEAIAKLRRAQAEIRVLKDKLRKLNHDI